MEKRIFTSESVTEGHPDKVCDQVSDAVLDAILEQDPVARVACECSTTTGLMLVMGEISTSAQIDVAQIARNTIRDIGYNADCNFDPDAISVLVALDKQSPDIAQGVNNSFDDASQLGAGDQGMMFGFACDETPELMPAPISFAHRLTRALTSARKGKGFPWLRPDGKSQVSVEYDENGDVRRIDTVVVSTQHSDDVPIEIIRECVADSIIRMDLPADLIDKDTKIFVNPTGRFVIGGPVGDSGLTGRKIIVDTYGGYASHGGGAFSGKDPTKVDRSAAYMARYVAKNIVAAGLARKCQIELAYAIGVAEPVSVLIDCYGTSVVPESDLTRAVRKCFDLRPAAIIERLNLRRPIYKQTAAYGHFGRNDLDLPWERTDTIDALKNCI